MSQAVRVTVWNENLHETMFEEIRAIYPEGIHGCIAGFLKDAGYDVKTATLQEAEHGLTQDVLERTDVLIWWGHMAHHKVEDAVVDCCGAVGGWSGRGGRIRSGGRARFAERPDALLELALAREFGIGIGGG